MKIIKQWPVFFLLLAFAIAPLFQGLETDVLALVYVLLLVVFVKVFLVSYTEFRIPYNSLALCICLFYIWMALSISWSPAPSISLYMFVWLSIFPLCYLIYSLKQSDDWSYLPIGILCITLIFALIGISQEFITKSVPSSFFLEKNTYAGMLNLIAQPTAAWFIIYSKKRRKHLSILLGTALFILFFAIFQTASRGAAISLLFGLFFISLISLKYIEKSLLIRVFVILMVAFLFADLETASKKHNITNRLEKLQNQEYLLTHRGVTWKPAWQIIKTSPMIGTGIGTFFIVFPAVRHPQDGSSGNYLHNDYLQFWLETGFIGLSFLVLIMVAVSMLSIRLLRNKSLQRIDRLEITGLLAGLTAVALHTFVDFNFYIVAILMVLGFICARIQEIHCKYSPNSFRSFIPVKKISKIMFVLLAFIIPIIIINYVLPVALADFYWKKAKEQIQSGKIKQGELTLEFAGEWNPNNIRIHFQRFLLYIDALRMAKNHALESERKVLFAKALLILNKINNINSLAAIVPESRGHLLIENTDIVIENWEEKAIGQFKKALQLDPRLYRARSALARLFVNRGNLDEAVRLINDGVKHYYPVYMTGIEKFYQYAINLNLMNGDTVKAKEIQLKWENILIDKYKNDIRLNPQQHNARFQLAKLLEKQGNLDKAVMFMNDGVNIIYEPDLTDIDEFYNYAVRLNLMNGDTAKAKKIQIEKGLLLGK